MFDYEWATVQHTVNCRLAQGVVVPDAIPPRAPLSLRGAAARSAPTRGLRRSTTWPTSSPIRRVLDELGLDPVAPIAVVRTPPDVSLYHRFENDLFTQVLDRLRGAQAVVLPRTPEQRAELRRGGFIVPERAIDSQSLIAFADLVVSAGGTMNREAVALGTPVFTRVRGPARGGRRALIAEGRLRRLRAADEVELVKRSPAERQRPSPPRPGATDRSAASPRPSRARSSDRARVRPDLLANVLAARRPSDHRD